MSRSLFQNWPSFYICICWIIYLFLLMSETSFYPVILINLLNSDTTLTITVIQIFGVNFTVKNSKCLVQCCSYEQTYKGLLFSEAVSVTCHWRLSSAHLLFIDWRRESCTGKLIQVQWVTHFIQLFSFIYADSNRHISNSFSSH